MADLSKIQRGDKLKLEVEVLRVCCADTKSGWQVEVRTVSRRSACGFLLGGLAENAEHIPAPTIRDDLDAMAAIQILAKRGYALDDIAQALEEQSDGS